MKTLKIRTKIMLWYTLLSLILLGALIPTVYTTVSVSLHRTIQADLQVTLSQIFSSIDFRNGQIFLDAEEMDIEDQVCYAVIDPNGAYLYRSNNADWLTEQQALSEESTLTVNGGKWAVQSHTYEIEETNITVVAASSMDYVEDSLQDLIFLLLLLIPIYLVVSAIGAFLLAKRAMRPIRQITQTARAIGEGDMSNRIQEVYAGDEVGELASTFNGMLDQLEVSFQRERQFTSDASHELRTPITVISACAEDALTDKKGDHQENLEIVKREAARMTKIIAQLLMLSRGYEGRYRFEADQICLYDMADSVTEELKASAEEMGIGIHNNIDKSLALMADQSLMTQLFINLIGNAIKYGREGGNIWLNARLLEHMVQIKISDDGIGIAPEDQQHIFERFYRADKARDRSGSGLGLAIAKWIAELHNGDITVKSSLGHGTTFEILLPR